MAIAIEKAVPIPPPRQSAAKYPFADMEVGDSFWLPYSEPVRRNLHNCARSYAKHHRATFAVRKLLEHDEWIVRCWRTS